MAQLTTLDVKFSEISSSAETRVFTGYASTFGNADLGGDVVAPGAFTKSLEAHKAAGRAPRMFFMHDPGKVPGRWLELREDQRGLFCKGEFARTQLGDECRELLKSGAIDALSIGYQTVRSTSDRDGNRVLLEVALHEISIVSLPMNPAARVVSAKAALIAGAVKTITDHERLLREAFGLSRGVAKRLASRTWPHFKEALHGDPASDALDDLSGGLEHARAVALIRAATYHILRSE